MLIATQKRKENIAEFVIYMWHVQDLIRSYNFDIDKIDQFIIQKYEQTEQIKNEIKEWYKNLIESIKNEKIEKTGHLIMIKSVMDEMDNLHKSLLNKSEETQYVDLYKKAAPNIVALREKSNDEKITDIEVCLNGLYGVMMMRLQKKEITKDTEAAIQSFSDLLALLSAKFKLYEEGKLEI